MSKPVKFTIFALTLASILWVAGFEVALRIVFNRSMDFDIEMWKYATRLKEVARYPGMGHQHKPNSSAFLMGVQVEINAKRLRGSQYDYAKPKDVKRILMLGDSLTFGWGVRVENTPSKILERLLNDTGKGYQVINAGVGNYNTEQAVTYFNVEGKKYNPDIVVLNYFLNDAEPLPNKKENWLSTWSYAYIFLMGRLDTLRRELSLGEDWKDYYLNLYKKDQEGWIISQRKIAWLADYCKANGIKLLISNYPELHELDNYPFANVKEALNEISDEKGVEFIDLTEAVRGLPEETLWVSPADAHPNAEANTRFARMLSKKIREMMDQAL